MPGFVRLVLGLRTPALRGHALGQVLRTADRSPDRLVRLYRTWTADASAIRRTRPALAFAVVGQARARGRLPQTPLKAAPVRNMLEELNERHRGLQGRRLQYEPALGELDTAIENFRGEVPAADYLRSLSARREWLERDMAAIGSELRAKQPGVDPDDLRNAKSDRDAAKYAAEEAPKAVQRAQYELQMASDSLAQAEKSQQDAQNNFNKVEAQIVTGIEVSAPNAAGFVTARAQLPPRGSRRATRCAGRPVRLPWSRRRGMQSASIPASCRSAKQPLKHDWYATPRSPSARNLERGIRW